MNIKSIVIGASLLVIASTAVATPQYTGSTTSDGPLALNQGAGYYIWNDANATNNWFVRWTSTGQAGVAEWFGDLEFENQNLGTFNKFSFETNQYTDVLNNFDTNTSSFLSWNAYTSGNGVDGFNFTLNDDFELMQFALGSSLYSDLDQVIKDPGVTSTRLYIGDGYASTNVLVLQNDDGETYQQFEVLVVPEPGTLALLGLGLVGLGAARRRQKA